jgi:integrase
MKRRLLPKWVSAFQDRHGKERLRFRRQGSKVHYFSAKFGTEAFRDEYRACLDGTEIAIKPGLDRIIPGSISDLIMRYVATPSRLGPSEVTQRKVRHILESFRSLHGHRLVVDVEFEHVDAIIAEKSRIKTVNKRKTGGPQAAHKLRKELRRLFDFAVKIRMREDNPVNHSDTVKVKSKGYHTWSEAEIAQFRDHHAVGTMARLALEMLLWTGQRRGDVIVLGEKNKVDGKFVLTQAKTGKVLWLPIAPQLSAAIKAMPSCTAPTYLVSPSGKPFTNAFFGNWFREQCDAAGLPGCTAHGLRKAISRRMADLGHSNQLIKSITGHSRDSEVALYTKAADQKRMAETTISDLSLWELANPHDKVAKSSEKSAENRES